MDSFGCCTSSKQVVMSPPRDVAGSVASSHSAVMSPSRGVADSSAVTCTPRDQPKPVCRLLKVMGKFFGCYPSSEEHVLSPPHEAVESESKPLLEEIARSVNDTDASHQIDPLIRCIEDQLRIIKAASEASTSSSSKGIQVETVSSGIDVGGQIVYTVSKAAEKLAKEEILKEMGNIAINTVNAIAQTHWIFVGLSVVGYALHTYIKVTSNVSGCIELLEKLAELAKDLSEFKEAGLQGNPKLSKAVHVILESAVMCLDYIKNGNFSRYLLAGTVEESLQKVTDKIKEIRLSLTLTGVINVRKQFYEFLPSKPKPLDFEPVGIEEQVKDVKKLLNMEGSEPAVAVILCGFGGVGKTTLASHVIYQLDLPSNFKYCKVTIDETKEKGSHIKELQEQIIHDLGDEKVKLRDPDEGKRKIKEILGKQCCFLYIDNVVERDYIEDLLPPKMVDEEKHSQKLRMIITSRAAGLRGLLNIKTCEEYRLNAVPDEAAKIILRGFILHGDELHQHFDEEGLINDVSVACKGVPLLLSVYGKHLRDGREKDKYEEALDALRKGDLNSFVEQQLEQKLLFVYHKLKDFDEEAQEVFLDICSYFQGWRWDFVGEIVGKRRLETLHNRMLINRREPNKVIVHDILLLMGRKVAKNTRFLNSEDSFKALKDKSKLQNVKGISLLDNTSLMRLQSSELNAVHSSLRVLLIGNWVYFDGPCCDGDFENLRYLHVGDINVFPFKDASNLKNLVFFSSQSNPEIYLSQFAQLPGTLKCMEHDASQLKGVDAIAKLPEELKLPASLRYLSLRNFELAPETLSHLDALEYLALDKCDIDIVPPDLQEPCKLKEGLKLPVSLSTLILNECKQVPQTWGCLNGLQWLTLTKCDMKILPRGFETFSKLRELSLKCCTNLTSLPSGIGCNSSLSFVDLRRCTRLQELPADFGRLRALNFLLMEGCENLTALPENMGGLSSLQELDLKGCIKLQRLPESFGRLSLQSLNLDSLHSLEELPQSIGDLAYLRVLVIVSCDSLSSLPDSFVQLKMLETLVIYGCTKLCRLPKNFGRLTSLQSIVIRYCSLKELPHGSELTALKSFDLEGCNKLVGFPACFEKLACLEKLAFAGLLSTLPNDLGKLKNLKKIKISKCHKLQTFPDDLEKMVSLEKVIIQDCEMMEGAAIERLVKLQQCYFVDISGSPKLIEQWKEMQQGEEDYPCTVTTSSELDQYEWDRAAIVGLFRGRCIQLDSSADKLINHPSMFVAENTTVAVIKHSLHLQRLVGMVEGMAMQRRLQAFTEQLRVIYLTKVELNGQRTKDTEEEESIREVLKQLPEGSFVIPSSETRRILLLQHLLFDVRGKDACFIADIRLDDQGRQILVDSMRIGEDEILGRKLSSASNQGTQNVDDLTKYFSSPNELQCTWQEFTKAVKTCNKKNNIEHDLDSTNGPVEVGTLKEKVVALIMCDFRSCECINLQQIYEYIKDTHADFEAVWIPLLEDESNKYLSTNKYYGYGTYKRAIQPMPWLSLPKPKFLASNENPIVVLFDKNGSIFNQNALTAMIAWGANAYPFTDEKISEITFNMHTKCSLEFLLHGMDIKGPGRIKVTESINNRVTFLYAEPPNKKSEINSKLKQLITLYKEIEILYVGNFFNMEQQSQDAAQEQYENATQEMQWNTLSFWDMVKFWYRCKYLQLNLMLAKHLCLAATCLVLFDIDGIVTLGGIDVVEYMIYRSNDKRTPQVDIIMDDMVKSLSCGKCNQAAKTFFRDELSNHPEHPQHHLYLTNKNTPYYCNVCYIRKVPSPIPKRRYRCLPCDWDLCADCWEVFAKEQI